MSKLKKKDANDVRCVASDCICKLYDAGSIEQLRLLEMQVDRSLEELDQPLKEGRGGKLFRLCLELDAEMDGVKCPATAAAILNGIRGIVGRFH